MCTRHPLHPQVYQSFLVMLHLDCVSEVLLVALGLIYSFQDLPGTYPSGVRFGLPIAILVVAVPRICMGYVGVKYGKHGRWLLLSFGSISFLELFLDVFVAYYEGFLFRLSTHHMAQWLGWAVLALFVRLAVVCYSYRMFKIFADGISFDSTGLDAMRNDPPER